jgi:hypothetical protein
MRSKFSLLVAICLLFVVTPSAPAQNPEDALHAPDGGAREMIVSIFISPLAGAPFQTILNTEWTKHLPDGTTTTVTNHRMIVRDSRGRIYQERQTLVPKGGDQQSRVFRIEISDPKAHTKYFCNRLLTVCQLQSYDAPVSEAVVPVGPIANGTRYLSRASLGSKTIEGVDTIGTRETETIQTGVIGNTAPIDITKEFWYSPKLGINLQVTRLDPLHGDQTFTVSDFSLSEPDSRLFVLPAGCKVIDLREKNANTSAQSSPK